MSDDGYKLSRDEKFWFANFNLVRRAGLTFSYTDEEILEYAKCKFGIDENDMPYQDGVSKKMKLTGVQYFAENYCKIKNEQGQIKNIRLRDYQKEIMDMFINNRFSVLMAARQGGKCNIAYTKIITNNGETTLFEIWREYNKNLSFLEKIKYFLYDILVKLQ
jgi:hypothetical protein